MVMVVMVVMVVTMVTMVMLMLMIMTVIVVTITTMMMMMHQWEGKAEPVTILLIESYISLALGGSACFEQAPTVGRSRIRRYFSNVIICLRLSPLSDQT